MLAIERKNEILAILQKEQRVLVSELSRRYEVTDETIRRDLEKLEKEGFVKRTYGGAVLNKRKDLDMPLRIREKTNRGEKQIIAGLVKDLIEEGDRIMLDASSTSLMISKELKEMEKLTVITNSVEVLIELAGRLEIHTPPVCDEPDWNHFLIPVECGIFRNWNRWNETLPETTDLPLKTQYTFPGCFNYLDTFEVPANSLYMMRFRFTIEEPKMVRVIFNCNAVSRVWVDGVFQFGRDGGWMAPSYDTVPLNQFCDMELDAGIHELVAGVAPGSPEENIYWVMGVANCSDCQWLPYAFFNSIDE